MSVLERTVSSPVSGDISGEKSQRAARFQSIRRELEAECHTKGLSERKMSE